MNLGPEIMITMVSTFVISIVCIIILNEITERGIIRRFKRPKLSSVKEEYKKLLKKR